MRKKSKYKYPYVRNKKKDLWNIRVYTLVHKYCLLLLLGISKELLHLISRWNVSLDVLMDYLASPWPCG